MRDFIVEKDFMMDEFRCVIVGMDVGHRCGYIGIPKGHVLYEMDYYDIDDLGIQVHGGWTYANRRGDYPVLGTDLWWIGFDCAHSQDERDLELMWKFKENESIKMLMEIEEKYPTFGEVRTIEYVENEIINAVKSIQKLEIMY